MHRREVNLWVLLKSPQQASGSILVLLYWGIISMQAAIFDEDSLQLIRKQAWTDKSTDVSAIVWLFTKTAELTYQHEIERELLGQLSPGVSWRQEAAAKGSKENEVLTCAWSKSRLLCCITKWFPFSLNMVRNNPTFLRTLQHCQMDFLTSHVIKAKDSRYFRHIFQIQ